MDCVIKTTAERQNACVAALSKPESDRKVPAMSVLTLKPFTKVISFNLHVAEGRWEHLLKGSIIAPPPATRPPPTSPEFEPRTLLSSAPYSLGRD